MASATKKRSKALFALITLVLVSVVLFALGEVAARLMGQTPWSPQKGPKVTKSDPDTPRVGPDPVLGFAHVPGRFTVTLHDEYTYVATHGEDRLRITRPQDAPRPASPTAVLGIFGCSFTYGEALSDHETYPWLLQQRFPRADVLNFGVIGYGTIHSLLQLREVVKAGRRIDVAVVAYQSSHDDRNTLLRDRRKKLRGRGKDKVMQPFARLGGADGRTLELGYGSVKFTEVPLMRVSALVNAIEQAYDSWENRTHRIREISRALIKEFAAECARNRIAFVLAGIKDDAETREMLKWCAEDGIATVDLGLDLDTDPKKMRVPFDGHPSAVANRAYADKLAAFLLERGLVRE